jgi:hypothetical protein
MQLANVQASNADTNLGFNILQTALGEAITIEQYRAGIHLNEKTGLMTRGSP